MNEFLNWISVKYTYFSSLLSDTFSEYIRGNKIAITMLLLFVCPIIGYIIIGKKKSKISLVRVIRKLLSILLTLVPAYFASSFSIKNYNEIKKIGIGNFSKSSNVISPEFAALLFVSIAFFSLVMFILSLVKSHKLNQE